MVAGAPVPGSHAPRPMSRAEAFRSRTPTRRAHGHVTTTRRNSMTRTGEGLRTSLGAHRRERTGRTRLRQSGEHRGRTTDGAHPCGADGALLIGACAAPPFADNPEAVTRTAEWWVDRAPTLSPVPARVPLRRRTGHNSEAPAPGVAWIEAEARLPSTAGRAGARSSWEQH